MNNGEVHDYLVECWKEVKELESIIKHLGSTDKKSSFLTKYTLIRCCGTFEVSYKTVIARCAGFKLCSRTEKYIESSIVASSNNPNIHNMLNLLKKFDKSWSSSFESRIDNHNRKSRIKSAVKNLVNLRNSFAHGQSTTTTFHDVKSYFVEACRVVKILDEIVGVPSEDLEHKSIQNAFRESLHLRLINLLAIHMGRQVNTKGL